MANLMLDGHMEPMYILVEYIDLVQERRNSNANVLELRLSCTNPSICEINARFQIVLHL